MGRDIMREDVPRLDRRPGDTVISGPNNSAILLGRDRIGGVDGGRGGEPGSGAVQVVVGRRGGGLLPRDDRASLYISSLSDPDEYVGTDGDGSEKGVSSVIAVADSLRFVARRDVKVSVGSASFRLYSDGRIVVEGDLSLGRGTLERAIRGDSFLRKYLIHVHPTAVGPSGPPQDQVTVGLLSDSAKVGT